MNTTPRIRTRTPRPAQPHATLPAPGARLTKRNLATYARFNAAIEALLIARGAELVRDLGPAGPDTLIGHALRTWRLPSAAGALEVTPCGAWIACRVEDPEALARIVGTLPVNVVSGKWNHHYWSWNIDEAAAQFAREIDRVMIARPGKVVDGAGVGECVVGTGGCGCIALAVGGGS